MAGAGDGVGLHGRGARVMLGESVDGIDTNRYYIGDREVRGSRAEEREIQGKGARDLGEIDEGRALPGAGGDPAADGAGGNPTPGSILRRVRHR